ncbi:MAG: DUF2786 domain-containing protein [Clostridia bacterium]|nr:DUF2786 domain-containing protein [Clostridia bacterium]
MIKCSFEEMKMENGMITDIQDKIAKLLALAESPNEHEARSALLKARALMAENKMRPEQVKQADSMRVIKRTIDITCTKMTNAWATRLSAIVAEHYCCKAFRSQRRGAKKVSIGFIGLEEDFEVCTRIFRYAFDHIESRCQAIKSKNKQRHSATILRAMADEYGNGFCEGLKDAFEEQQQAHQAWGLVLAAPQSVLDVWKSMGKSSRYGNAVRMNSRFALEGYQDGKAFDPSTKLSQRDEEPALALG